MSGCSSSASTADLVAVDDVEDAVRHARLLQQLGRQIDADGSFSDGFSTNVLPQASAGAHIHMGTIAGKLNGVIPATTPSGCRIEYTSTPVEACSEKLALEQLGDAAAVLDHLEPARHLAQRVGEHLAVLGGEECARCPRGGCR